MHVLGRKLCRGAALKRQHSGQQLLIDDRQAVLIAVVVGPAVKQFRGGVDGRQPTHHRAIDVLQILHQAEVRHLDTAAHEQQVLGLDVEVLERVFLEDVVQGIGGVSQMSEQLGARDAQLPDWQYCSKRFFMLEVASSVTIIKCPSTSSMRSSESKKGWRTSLMRLSELSSRLARSSSWYP